MRVTVYGRGGHGSMPQATVDPVVLAAMIVVRLQTVVSRVTPPSETVVLTVGSLQAGTKSNVIPDHAVLELNVRTYSEQTRKTVLDAITRIVVGGMPGVGQPEGSGVRALRPVPTDRQRRRDDAAAGWRLHRLLRRPGGTDAPTDRQ